MLNKAKRKGLLRYIRLSNLTPQHIRELVDETEYGIRGAFVQIEIHPWHWRDALGNETSFKEEVLRIVGYALLTQGRVVAEDCPLILAELAERRCLSKVKVDFAWALTGLRGVLVRFENEDHPGQNLGAPFIGQCFDFCAFC